MLSKLIALVQSSLLVFFIVQTAAAHGTDNKEFISPADLAASIGGNTILDVRAVDKFTVGHIPSAFSIPLDELSGKQLQQLEIETDSAIILYGVSESSARKAKMLLGILGYSDTRILAGGYAHWLEDGNEIEIGEPSNVINTEGGSEKANIIITPESHDFGVIRKQDGVVETTFTVQNNAKKELRVDEISTSCGCTTATIDNELIPPGKVRILTVYFNPNFHEEPEGKFSRTVFLQSDDNSESIATIQVEIAK